MTTHSVCAGCTRVSPIVLKMSTTPFKNGPLSPARSSWAPPTGSSWVLVVLWECLRFGEPYLASLARSADRNGSSKVPFEHRVSLEMWACPDATPLVAGGCFRLWSVGVGGPSPAARVLLGAGEAGGSSGHPTWIRVHPDTLMGVASLCSPDGGGGVRGHPRGKVPPLPGW